ncbi:hypothetical protein niasHT_010194 [Heterodera trifolii]|uniref:BTB domain-containing protein n=1 Tax=Heterodera trifolii TaxID=157864 RepID=A0ABD2MDN3_9BILA
MSSSLADRMKLMLSTGEDADVYFLAFIQAHKVILKRASDVFGAMFLFDAKKEKTENISAESLVVIPDIEAQAFKVMLSFIYAEDLSELNGDNVMAVLFAANKYNISLLVKACLDFPINELSDVFLAYKQARLLNKKAYNYNFARRCMDYIEQNVETLIKSESFLQIDQNLLCEIFDHNLLVITNELELWKAALRWADEKCRQNAIECSAENRRSALGPALFKIRFPLISRREFSQNIDEHWNCKCSATLRIVSRNSVTLEGFHFFTTCEHLMDPDKGFYDINEDKVTMSIEVAVKEQKGTKRKLSDE